jgi:class 3 adenylate cyclase
MEEDSKPPVLRIFVISVIIGILIAFGYSPLYQIIDGLFRENFKLGVWGEIMATCALGAVYLGLLIYFFSVFVVEIVTKNILNYLVRELRHRELLPATFKFRKQSGFKNIYSDIKKIFDTFIQLFLSVKQDKDKFAKAIDMHCDPTVKQQIEERGINEMYLGGKKKKATILFSDLRGFTSFTEFHDANDVVTILNQYLGEATKIVNKNKGKVNKYIGDAIMAVFEEPSKYIDYLDADKAILTALDMQTQFQLLLKQWKKDIDPMMDIGLGIGLARGEVVAGTIGSEERMEYTLIGDAVNLSSRLCSIALDGQVLISDDIYSQVQNFVVVDSLPPVEIKGKTGMYNLYSVTNRKMIV